MKQTCSFASRLCLISTFSWYTATYLFYNLDTPYDSRPWMTVSCLSFWFPMWTEVIAAPTAALPLILSERIRRLWCSAYKVSPLAEARHFNWKDFCYFRVGRAVEFFLQIICFVWYARVENWVRCFVLLCVCLVNGVNVFHSHCKWESACDSTHFSILLILDQK